MLNKFYFLLGGPQVKEYDAISRIDAWLTAQLLHIKKNIDSDDTIN